MLVYIDVVESNIYNEEKLRELFSKSDICVNLVGILYEEKKEIPFIIFILFFLLF